MSNNVVALVAIGLGFFAIPPLARMNPQLVNGFLILILFSSLLINRDRWLPYLDQTASAAGGKSSPAKTAGRL